ncbi:MAG TPA: FAD-dependent monooxygenase [Pseudonocardiaceae bacterium]|jgi:2-polyprenyl-6-methoxyphenol hydroxylase-like FAD-dependent oxidoreductase|nr:FAD-dependent monooxygenase [Pseudonocardiaceae bacterium]
MKTMTVSVIVVGAGPTGLMLASDLNSAGVSTVVLDKLPVGSKMPRAGAVQPRTSEVLAMRGLLPAMRAEAPNRDLRQGHFAGLSIDYSVLEPCGPLLHLEQRRIEAYLERALAEAGCPVLRGQEVVAVHQDADGVTAETAGGALRIEGRYLVAADGAHSTVRHLLGVGFPGRDGSETAIVADVRVRGTQNPILLDPTAQIGKPTRARDGSWAMVFALDDGWRRLFASIVDAPGREVPVTDTEIQAALSTVFGPETELAQSRHLSRISNAARQVPTYRVGRVFFAGDAAHVHLPFGGQGMNLGIQDAVNLSWKLVAAVTGWAKEELLDSYHAERYPVAAAVLRNSRAQGLLANFGALDNVDLPELRELVSTLVQLPQANRYLAGILSGVDIQYSLPGADGHPLVGRRMFDVPLTARRGALLGPSGAGRQAGLVAAWSDRVEHRETTDGPTVLVRPDGYVCWAGDEPTDVTGLTEALTRWFGPATTPAVIAVTAPEPVGSSIPAGTVPRVESRR